MNYVFRASGILDLLCCDALVAEDTWGSGGGGSWTCRVFAGALSSPERILRAFV
jgi:hypothetical protein